MSSDLSSSGHKKGHLCPGSRTLSSEHDLCLQCAQPETRGASSDAPCVYGCWSFPHLLSEAAAPCHSLSSDTMEFQFLCPFRTHHFLFLTTILELVWSDVSLGILVGIGICCDLISFAPQLPSLLSSSPQHLECSLFHFHVISLFLHIAETFF